MLTDPLTRFRNEAATIRRETRERVVVAVTAPRVPAFRRRREAERAVAEGRRDLENLRDRMAQGADGMANEACHGLFNLARMNAPHAVRDRLAEASTWSGAQHAASQVEDEAAAVHVIRHGLAQADRDPFRAIVAGAVALRAHREGWQTALGAFLDSARGRHLGGWAALEELTTWEAIARGDFPAWAADELEPAEVQAGRYWPAEDTAA